MDQTLRISNTYLFQLHQLIYLPCGIINLKSSKIWKVKKKTKFSAVKVEGKEELHHHI
jgi:hypothetical protein